MKRVVLPFAMLAVFLLTAAVLYASGWVTPRPQPSHSANAAHLSAHDPHPTEAALRYRQSCANHWRCCMLQR
jgi:hypothetical protein